MVRSVSYANVVMNQHNVEDENPENAGADENTTDPVVEFKSTMHPLYLQNIDHPGLVLISKKLTGTENFGPWKRSITIALSAKNKLGLMNGTFPRPEDDSLLRA